MKPANKQLLDNYRHHHDTVKLDYLRHLSGEERENMQNIMADEFLPGYTTDLWCQSCVFEMVKQLYHRYDEWIARQPEPVKVSTGFPLNKKQKK